MRWLLNIIGIVLVLLGGVWVLQGTNLIRNGFMAGHLVYAILGGVSIIIGILLFVVTNRRQKGKPI